MSFGPSRSWAVWATAWTAAAPEIGSRRLVSGSLPAGMVLFMPQNPSSAPVVISAYEDGPLIVRGGFVLRDEDGVVVDAGSRTVALCRCGYSRVKPLCDGTHKRTGFRSRASGGADR